MLWRPCAINGVKEIIYTSGSGIYGDVGTTPTPEDFGPLLPISFYGASKLACEGLISAFAHQYGMRAWIFRMGNVVGRRQTHGVGFDFINKLRADPTRLEILGDGSQSKSYVHVSDVVGAFLYVSQRATGTVACHNLATLDTIDVTSIAEIVIAEMGLSGVELTYTGGDRGWKGDVPQVRLPTDKIRALGWQAKHDSRQAVLRSVREMLGVGVGKPVQVCIMAGGLGTRLGGLTRDIPKSLVSVLGAPFIEYQIALLRDAGARRLVLCVGHLGEMISDRLGDGSGLGVEIAYSTEGEELLGTGGALRKAAPLLDDEFFLLWGDSYLRLDYAGIWQRARALDLPAVMVVYRNHNQRVPSNVALSGDRVAVYDKWTEDAAKVYVDEGLTYLRKKTLDRVPAGKPYAIEQVFAELAAEGRLGSHRNRSALLRDRLAHWPKRAGADPGQGVRAGEFGSPLEIIRIRFTYDRFCRNHHHGRRPIRPQPGQVPGRGMSFCWRPSRAPAGSVAASARTASPTTSAATSSSPATRNCSPR